MADDAFQNLPATAREALDFVFANLVRVDETTTRRRANLDQLQRHHGADEFLFAFQEAKLLSTGDEDGITVVTLVHESLLTHWPVLAEWIERHRNDLTAHQRLIRQAELWEANRESPKYLLTAGHLAEAERVAGSSIFLLSESQSKFLRRSRRAAQRKLRVFQFATVVFAALALLAALLGRKAVLARSDAQHALATLQGDKADTLFLRDDKIEAIPYLTSLLKKHPSNHLAAERLVSALTYRSFPLPHTRELTHGSRIHKVEFHPGGRYLGSAACAEFDGRAVLWDIDSGEILRSFRHDLCVEDLSFSADGRFLATASRDRTAKIWNIETGEAVSPPLEHKDEVKKVWLDATGTKLVSTTKGGESVLWEVSTGKRLLDLNSFGGGETKILSAQFSPDNRYLLVNFAYTNSVLIDCGTLESSEVFRNVGQGIFNRDGTKMAFAFPWSPALTFYDPIHRDRLSSRHHLDDPRNFRSPESPIESERLKIQGFDFSPEGQSVVAYLEGGDLRRIDLEQSHVLPHAQRSTRKVLTLKTFPDGLHAAARTEGWRQSDTVVLNLFPGETATGVMWHGKGALAIHPTRPLIATSSSQETKRSIRVWDTRPGEAFPQVRVFDGGITILSESSNRNHFAVVSDKESLLSVCRTSDLSVIDTHVFDSPIRALAMDETTDAFIVGLSDGRIFHGKVTDAGAVQEVLTVDGQIFGLILHPDGSAFAVIRRFPELRGRSPRVTTYCFDTFKVLFDQEIDFIPVDPWNFGWGANGSVFVSPALDYSYRLVTGDSGKPLVNQGLKALARVGFKSQRGQLMAFDPTDSRVATTNKEVARVFRSDNGDPVTAPMLHDGDVNSLDFHPSGKWLVTASEDGTARIWDAVGRGGEQVALSMEHGLPVIDAQFSPDGSRILTLTRMAARLWDTETGQPISDPFPLPATKTPADSAKGWARFCDGGQAILLASGDGRVARWETPTCPLPVPEWFCHLAESVVGERLDERGMPQPVDFGDLVGERNRALGFGESDRFYERFAHWFFSDRSKRSPAPESRRAMDDQVHYWIENATLPELLRARLLHPENREILKRIAANLKNSPHESERELARFLGSNLDRLTSANP
ncbi:MAG: WD40 repeat domain-containing protein [Verrucomicrobiae bacterium]|nr:WD40 repeat domain-containing protein [Verrucomicrobiae bacterium]